MGKNIISKVMIINIGISVINTVKKLDFMVLNHSSFQKPTYCKFGNPRDRKLLWPLRLCFWNIKLRHLRIPRSFFLFKRKKHQCTLVCVTDFPKKGRKSYAVRFSNSDIIENRSRSSCVLKSSLSKSKISKKDKTSYLKSVSQLLSMHIFCHLLFRFWWHEFLRKCIQKGGMQTKLLSR